MISTERLEKFTEEVQLIDAELKVIVNKIILTRMQGPGLYEEYAEKIDRIYGAAVTIGLEQFAKYALALKEVSYMCSQSKNENGKKKVTRMMIEYFNYVELACRSDRLGPEETFVFKNQCLREKKKAEKMAHKEFFGITRKSCEVAA
jgi:hypothetical protein